MAKTACLCQPIIWGKAAILRDSTVVGDVAAVMAPTNSTASHDNHEKINSRVSFNFLCGYGAPLGIRAAAAPLSYSFPLEYQSMISGKVCTIQSLNVKKSSNEMVFAKTVEQSTSISTLGFLQYVSK